MDASEKMLIVTKKSGYDCFKEEKTIIPLSVGASPPVSTCFMERAAETVRVFWRGPEDSDNESNGALIP